MQQPEGPCKPISQDSHGINVADYMENLQAFSNCHWTLLLTTCGVMDGVAAEMFRGPLLDSTQHKLYIPSSPWSGGTLFIYKQLQNVSIDKIKLILISICGLADLWACEFVNLLSSNDFSTGQWTFFEELFEKKNMAYQLANFQIFPPYTSWYKVVQGSKSSQSSYQCWLTFL